MKVLMTADTVGGVFTHATELTSALRRHDVEVVLVTFGGRATSGQRERVQAAGPSEWYESELALEWMEDPWDDLAAAQTWLLELEAQERPDIVHLNGFGHAAAPWLAPALVAAHSDVGSWWRAVHGTAPPRSWDRYLHWVRAGLDAAAAVVAPTRAMLSALVQAHGPLRAPASVIHNGTDAAQAPAAAAKHPYALAAGRLWDEAKNLRMLDAAATALPAGSVRVAGSPMAQAASHVASLGALEPAALGELRARAAVFAAPARYEPFGLAILEAARDGCALVLGDIPSLRELWDGAATFVATDEPAALADVLRDLLDDPDAAAAHGRRAQDRSRRYTATTMARRYAELYRRLAVTRAEALTQ